MGKSAVLLSIIALLILNISVHATQVIASVSVTVISTKPILTLSNSLIDQGQSILFSSQVATGDIGPFTYNYQIINTITNAVIANQLYVNVASSTNSFFWTPSSNDPGNTLEANVTTIDSNSLTLNSIYKTIGYNSAPTITLTPFSTTLTAGQTETFTFQESGGTGGVFNVELYNVTGNAQQDSNVVILGVGGSTLISFNVIATGNFVYNAIATDEGTTTPFVFNSTNVTITVTPKSSGGGGGTGGGGGGGGSGSSKPVITPLPNGCLLISNIAVPNTFNVSLDGYSVPVTESFIASNFTAIIALGSTYTLYSGVKNRIDGTPIYIQLVNVSYLPIQHTVTLEACSTSSFPITGGASALPQVAFTYIPYYTSLLSGRSYSTQIGIKDTSAKPEYVNLSVGGNFSSVVSISTSSLYMQPGQSVGAEIKLSAMPSLAAGLYIIPLNLTISVANSKSIHETEFLTLAVYASSPTQPGILNQISIINYTNSSGSVASGTIEIISPSNSSLVNATLETLLPISLVSNASKVSTYGLPSNLSLQNGSYVILWQITNLPPNQLTYAYYTIKNPVDQPTLERIQNLLAVPSPTSPQLQSILKIVNISIPTFYTHSDNHIYVQALYTGSSPGNVNFTMVAPNGVQIYNGINILNVTPNQYLTNNFMVETDGKTGTMVLTLYVSANGQTTTYTLPVVIMQKTSSQQTLLGLLESSPYTYYFIVATAAIICGIFAYRIGKSARIKRYSPERDKETELEDIKELMENRSEKPKPGRNSDEEEK